VEAGSSRSWLSVFRQRPLDLRHRLGGTGGRGIGADRPGDGFRRRRRSDKDPCKVQIRGGLPATTSIGSRRAASLPLGRRCSRA